LGLIINPYVYGTGAQTDPDFASVVSLLHFDGADASTTFTDVIGKTWTANGNAQLDTAQFKYGTASLLLDGTGDYLLGQSSADWAFGTGDFTVEAWVRFNSIAATQSFFSQRNGAGTTGWTLQWSTTGPNLRFLTLGDSGIYAFSWSPSTNTWYHVEVTRSGTNLRAFINGTQIGTTQTDSSNMASSDALEIGKVGGLGAQYVNGWIDDSRITKGVARHTANFTAPTAAHPNS
jgi:hypothetical protein